MVDMIADRKFKYRGRSLTPGTPFNPTRAHARLLAATGRATLAELGTISAPTPPRQTKRAPDPIAHSPDSAPGLKGKNRAKLLKIARAEKVEVPADADTNAKIAAVIEARRKASVG